MIDTTTLVPKYFEMNPKTDDLIRNGTFLEEGMTVLLECSDYRVNLLTEGVPTTLNEGYAITEQALRWNRWVTVENLGWGGMDSCAFVGVYADGTKKLISVNQDYAWYVKKSSIPDPEALAKEEAAAAKDQQERGIPVEAPPGGVRISVEPTRVWPGDQ